MPVRNDTRHLPVKRMDISEISWLAGIIEGEGSFSAKKYESGRAFRLNVKMTDRDIITQKQIKKLQKEAILNDGIGND